jgi:hypothetical protein
MCWSFVFCKKLVIFEMNLGNSLFFFPLLTYMWRDEKLLSIPFFCYFCIKLHINWSSFQFPFFGIVVFIGEITGGKPLIATYNHL